MLALNIFAPLESNNNDNDDNDDDNDDNDDDNDDNDDDKQDKSTATSTTSNLKRTNTNNTQLHSKKRLKSSKSDDVHCATRHSTNEFRIIFHLFETVSKAFRRSSPGIPDFCCVVCK